MAGRTADPRQNRIAGRRAGLGDTINFARYAPLVAALGAVILDVPAPLKEIAASVPGVALVLEDGESVPPVDFYCPLMSLPLVFQTEIGTIPASIPYIRPHAESPAKWRARLPRNGRLRVGLCWAGSGAHLNDHNRSIAIERFAGILSLSNLDFISVQKEVSEPQAAFLRQYHVIQLGQDFENFADTAAALAGTVRGRGFAQEGGIRPQPLACHIDIDGEFGFGLSQRRRAAQLSRANQRRFLLDEARQLLDDGGQIGERLFRVSWCSHGRHDAEGPCSLSSVW
ncbi:MAG: hypothetical protein WB495_09805 [Xanthobacteraceae bacterium]